MRCPRVMRSSRGFTLIELLVVIGIIAALAGILLPVLAIMKTRAKIGTARREMQSLTVAVTSYKADYSHYPCSKIAEKKSAGSDFTFGTANVTLSGAPNPIYANVGYETNNSELVMILLGVPGPGNPGNVRNPRKKIFWEPAMVAGTVGGVSMDDYVARDPWGSPYIVTFDMNNNNRCRDTFYARSSVSERQANNNNGFYGLSRAEPGDSFEANGAIIIWSAGRDRSYNPKEKANEGANRDNVLSWSN